MALERPEGGQLMELLRWCVEHGGTGGYRAVEWFETELEAMGHAWEIEREGLGFGEFVRVMEVRREVRDGMGVTCGA